MQNNDQLTKYERLRLECVAQAFGISSLIYEKRPTIDQIFETAREIEKFLRAANPN